MADPVYIVLSVPREQWDAAAEHPEWTRRGWNFPATPVAMVTMSEDGERFDTSAPLVAPEIPGLPAPLANPSWCVCLWRGGGRPFLPFGPPYVPPQ
jgi:hypothetical protein